MSRLGWRTRCVAGLAVLLLCAPGATAATIEYHYESWVISGHTTTGVYDTEELYNCPDGTPGGRTWLSPDPPVLLTAAGSTATTANGKIDTFYEALVGEFGAGTGWTFAASPNELTGVFDVHTYDAVGTTAVVGADFHVEYRPGANLGNLHWIQVLFTNHPLRGANTGHGFEAAYVDISNARPIPSTILAGPARLMPRVTFTSTTHRAGTMSIAHIIGTQ